MRKAIIENTTVFDLPSEVVGDNFEITIMSPDVDSDEPLPAVYLSDANNMLGTACDAINNLMFGGEIPPILLVGVGYPIDGNFSEFIRLRTRDFSPSRDDFQAASMAKYAGLEANDLACSGAHKFLQFLTTELREFVESRFACGSANTFVGNSMGGLFGTYALLNQPQHFQNYILGSPWYSWDYPFIFKQEETYARSHKDLDARVYMAVGAKEHLIYPEMPEPLKQMFGTADTEGLVREMFTKIENRNYPNLSFTGEVLDEETHFSIIGRLLSKGLREIFAKKPS